jgi:glutathione S-transferase
VPPTAVASRRRPLDDDGTGIWESMAIHLYLVEKARWLAECAARPAAKQAFGR